MVRIVGLLLVFVLTVHAQATDRCDEWLKSTNSIPGQADCEIVCSSSDSVLGTSICSLGCHDYCRSKCIHSAFWDSALKSDPKPFRSIEGNEKESLQNALDQVPKPMQAKSLKSLVRASSPDFFSPSNPASTIDDQIILFPHAFSPTVSLVRLITHELAHVLIANEWAKNFEAYKSVAGWTRVKAGQPRTGDFVEPDGKDSPEEDFANNVEYYLFEPDKLKTKSAKIYSWIAKTFGKNLKLGEPCGH